MHFFDFVKAFDALHWDLYGEEKILVTDFSIHPLLSKNVLHLFTFFSWFPKHSEGFHLNTSISSYDTHLQGRTHHLRGGGGGHEELI